MNEARGEFEQEIITRVDEARIATESVVQAERRAREMIVRLAEETGSRKPIPGGSTVSKTRLVYDPGAAFAFARQKGMFLKLDASAFEHFARTNPGEVRGVVREEPYLAAQIASDLDKVLPPQSPTDPIKILPVERTHADPT